VSAMNISFGLLLSVRLNSEQPFICVWQGSRWAGRRAATSWRP
jgi:hypothetical protein